MTEAIFRSFQLGPYELTNRIVMAPMTRARAGEDRVPKSHMATYYAERATAGLLIAEATTISEQGLGWNQSPGIYTDAMTDGWKRVVDAVHAAGGKIFLQLWHCGRASHSSFRADRSLPVAPSAIAIQGDGIHTPEGKQPYEVPRALESAEIPLVVEDYRRAAARAHEAGFDGVEIHSANGYLLDTFMESKTNHRTDAYGGSIENRYRLLGEIVAAVASVWPANQIGVRFSPNGVFNDMGSPDYREQFLYAAGRLNEVGLGYLHVMDGLAFGFHGLGKPMTLSEFRQVFHGPLMANCGYNHVTAEAAVAGGNADLVAIGRPFITNPDLVARYKNGWPLNPDADMPSWYSHGLEGYLGYPHYQP